MRGGRLRPPRAARKVISHNWVEWDQEKEGNVEFVMFEDVDGMEVYVNPERVIWVREYPNHTTVISCGHDDKFAVRLAPSHAVAALGKTVR